MHKLANLRHIFPFTSQSHCLLNRIGRSTFSALDLVEVLHLNGNHFKRIDKKIFAPIKQVFQCFNARPVDLTCRPQIQVTQEPHPGGQPMGVRLPLAGLLAVADGQQPLQPPHCLCFTRQDGGANVGQARGYARDYACLSTAGNLQQPNVLT